MKKKELKKRIEELTDLSMKLYKENQSLKRDKARVIMDLTDYRRKIGAECLLAEEIVVDNCIRIVRND